MLPEYQYPNHKHTLLVQDTQYSCYQEIFRPWSPISKQSYNGASLVHTHVRRHPNLASRKNIHECGHRKPPSVSAFRFSLNSETKIMFFSRGLQTKIHRVTRQGWSHLYCFRVPPAALRSAVPLGLQETCMSPLGSVCSPSQPRVLLFPTRDISPTDTFAILTLSQILFPKDPNSQ